MTEIECLLTSAVVCVYIIGTLFAANISACYAKEKNRNELLWFFGTLIFSSIITLIIRKLKPIEK